MIAREGKSPIEVAGLFNEQKVGGRQTWSDNMIRKLYSRERLVGREVFRTTRQEFIAPISTRRCSSARSVAAAGRR